MTDIQSTLLDAVESMPAFPESVHQVLKLSNDIQCSQKELVEVIRKDPVFTLKILRLVNSPYFGLSREVLSINHASVYLGLNTLKNIALGLAAVGAIPKSVFKVMDIGAFWLHSLATATCARMLGMKLGVSRDTAADFFAAGLLHDIGKVVCALYLPDEYARIIAMAAESGVAMHQCELEVLGMTHADIGAMLADKWGIPAVLRDAIAGHHDIGNGGVSQMADCLFAANQIVKKLAYGSAGDFYVAPLPVGVHNLFFMTLDELITDLPTLDDEVDKARLFIKLGEAG